LFNRLSQMVVLKCITKMGEPWAVMRAIQEFPHEGEFKEFAFETMRGAIPRVYSRPDLFPAQLKWAFETSCKEQYLRQLGGVDCMVNAPKCSYLGNGLINKNRLWHFRKQF
jgi:hypothetical protein